MQLIKNLLYLSWAEVASKIVTLLAIAYLARVGGPVSYGFVEFASAVLFCAGLLVDQGLSPFGAREIARAPSQTAKFAKEIILARFILAVVAYAGVITFTLLFSTSPVLTQLLLVYGFGLLAIPLHFQWIFQGHDRMHIVAGIQLIRQAGFALLVFVLVHDQAHISYTAVADVAGVTLAALFGVWVYWRQFGIPHGVPWTLSRRLFRESVPIGLGQMFWALRMYGATLVLGLVASAQDVGYFGGTMRILVALHAFVWLYYFNLLPSLSRAWQKHDGTFSSLIDRSLHSISWLGMIGGMIWVLLAPTVVTGVYGIAFAPAGVTLQWLAVVFVMAAVSGHYRFGLIAADRQRAEMVTSILGSATAVILIPILYAGFGHNGAAVALVIGESVVLGSSWWLARRALGLRGHLKTLMRPVVAGVVVVGALLILPPSSEIVRAGVVVISMAAFAFLLDQVIRDSVVRVMFQSQVWLRARLDKRAQEAV